MKPEIVAELAQGFEGRVEQAMLLMKAAAKAGADAAKFQLVYADELATPDYQYYELFQTLEMTDGEWKSLAGFGAENGVELHVDIFGSKSLQLAEKLGVQVIKLHGTDISNVGLLVEVAGSSVPRVMLGAGGAYHDEIERALEILSGKKVVVLLGFQGYPTPNDANQIARVRLFTEKYASDTVSIGFADHATPDTGLRYGLAATAIGAGACVIEKHLTLGKVMEIEDFESALNPDEFVEFCDVVRSCAEALGATSDTPNYNMSESELGYRKMIRRHVISAHDLKEGQMLSASDVVLKRCSSENVLTDIEAVYGKVLTRPVAPNSPVTQEDI
ncbi:NeuB family protein [uncultured Woeseiaceae bacterium]|uniref:NeuB family protein n=1 Tax=uncultured Woeseiaceae bacterium TaxID=1983305 RepID=A0A7D9H377_9GAMM|nr:NeuB family protein [uncultured Woeseiaceae bacterium]